MSRLSKAGSVHSKCQLCKRIGLTVLILCSTNTSAAWYTQAPACDVTGTLLDPSSVHHEYSVHKTDCPEV